MENRVLLCIDSKTRRGVLPAGLAEEARKPFSWLACETCAEACRTTAKRSAYVDEVWVASCDDMEPINVAAAVKQDDPAKKVFLVSRGQNGSLASRAANAGLDALWTWEMLEKRYAEMAAEFSRCGNGRFEGQVFEGRVRENTRERSEHCPDSGFFGELKPGPSCTAVASSKEGSARNADMVLPEATKASMNADPQYASEGICIGELENEGQGRPIDAGSSATMPAESRNRVWTASGNRQALALREACAGSTDDGSLDVGKMRGAAPDRLEAFSNLQGDARGDGDRRRIDGAREAEGGREAEDVQDVDCGRRAAVENAVAIDRGIAVVPDDAPHPVYRAAGAPVKEGAGTLVAVVSGSGGCGKSTLSAVFSLIAAQSGLRTAAFDADFQFGDLDYLLGVPSPLRMEEIVEDPSRLLTAPAPADASPFLVAAPRRLEVSELVVGHVGAVASALKQAFDVVVVNTGSMWADGHAGILEAADAVAFVMDSRPSSLRATVHAVELCARLGVATTSFVFVVNRHAKTSLLSAVDVSCALRGARAVELADGGRDVDELLGAGYPRELIASKNAFIGDARSLLADMLPSRRSEAVSGKGVISRKRRSLFGRGEGK